MLCLRSFLYSNIYDLTAYLCDWRLLCQHLSYFILAVYLQEDLDTIDRLIADGEASHNKWRHPDPYIGKQYSVVEVPESEFVYAAVCCAWLVIFQGYNHELVPRHIVQNLESFWWHVDHSFQVSGNGQRESLSVIYIGLDMQWSFMTLGKIYMVD